MLLQQRAKDEEIPEEMNIRKFLTERKNRFTKFTREYDDYKRFRESLKKKSKNDGASAAPVGIDNMNRFTSQMIKRLIEECRNLAIEKDNAYNYDEAILQDDIIAYEEWRL